MGVALLLRLVQAQRADDGQTLGNVESQLAPLEDIGTAQAQEVACACVVDIETRAVEVARPPRLSADFPALVDQ